jgi:hypothetical protein
VSLATPPRGLTVASLLFPLFAFLLSYSMYWNWPSAWRFVVIAALAAASLWYAHFRVASALYWELHCASQRRCGIHRCPLQAPHRRRVWLCSHDDAAQAHDRDVVVTARRQVCVCVVCVWGGGRGEGTSDAVTVAVAVSARCASGALSLRVCRKHPRVSVRRLHQREPVPGGRASAHRRASYHHASCDSSCCRGVHRLLLRAPLLRCVVDALWA